MKPTYRKTWILLLAPACILMASCKQESPEIAYKSAVADALEDVEDKASADDAAKTIEEAKREYQKSKIDLEQASKRRFELIKQIQEKNCYGSEALNYVL